VGTEYEYFAINFETKKFALNFETNLLMKTRGTRIGVHLIFHDVNLPLPFLRVSKI